MIDFKWLSEIRVFPALEEKLALHGVELGSFTTAVTITLIVIVLKQHASHNSLPSPSKPKFHSTKAHQPTSNHAHRKAPHEILLQYIHPSTSLWPPTYLRAFAAAQDGDGVVRIGMGMLVRDIRLGRVVVRGDFEVREDEWVGWC